MTLIELLVSLLLLAVISVIMASWMSMTLRTQSTAAADSAWNRSATGVLALIERDLFAVDRLDVGARRNEPRVEWANGKLRIRTRDQGFVGKIEYRLDSGRGFILRKQVGERSQSNQPPLLGEVLVFVVVIEEQSEFASVPELHVRIERSDGLAIERVFTLTVEDLQ
jgi:hypothetical protein